VYIEGVDALSADCSVTSGTGGSDDYVGWTARGRCENVDESAVQGYSTPGTGN
jgi:hypothetical protein